MKADRPRNTAMGCTHHKSRRPVSPKPRTTGKLTRPSDIPILRFLECGVFRRLVSSQAKPKRRNTPHSKLKQTLTDGCCRLPAQFFNRHRLKICNRPLSIELRPIVVHCCQLD